MGVLSTKGGAFMGPSFIMSPASPSCCAITRLREGRSMPPPDLEAVCQVFSCTRATANEAIPSP